jgi:hypothetical protein
VLKASHESSRLMNLCGSVSDGVFCAAARVFLRGFAIR